MQRLGVNDLEIGKTLPWDVFDESKHLLLKKGTVIERDAQIEQLLERGMFVENAVFDTWREQQDVLSQQRRSFDPFWTFEKIELRLSQVLHDAPDPEKTPLIIRKLASLVQELAQRDADACLSVVMTTPSRRYAAAHMLGCAIICELVAQRMEWSEQERHTCTCAALTMNVGMLDLQNILFHQRGPLTDSQQRIVHMHPAQSVAWLLHAGVDDDNWLQAVADHHENRQGSGYPTQSNQAASPMAELLHLTDVYTAKVTARAYRSAVPPDRAARELFVEEGSGEHRMAELVIKELGLYPPGTFVKLANGETAMVVRRGQNLTSPTVLSLSSGKGMPYSKPMKRTTDIPEHAIVAVVPSEKMMVRIDRREIWGHR